MRYTVKLKDVAGDFPLMIEAEDVSVDCEYAATDDDVAIRPAVFYYNFLININKDQPVTVGSIPFDNVLYVARV